jgi:SAM-dependent methyltransferase
MEDNNIWNDAFQKNRMIWGIEPSGAAKITEKVFSSNNVKTILVIGAGYGRNAKYFSDKNYIVDGIEYSREAIETGKIFAPQVNFIYGSILDYNNMNKKYERNRVDKQGLPRLKGTVYASELKPLGLHSSRSVQCILAARNPAFFIVSPKHCNQWKRYNTEGFRKPPEGGSRH